MTENIYPSIYIDTKKGQKRNLWMKKNLKYFLFYLIGNKNKQKTNTFPLTPTLSLRGEREGEEKYLTPYLLSCKKDEKK